jgi:hypothetical protein
MHRARSVFVPSAGGVKVKTPVFSVMSPPPKTTGRTSSFVCMSANVIVTGSAVVSTRIFVPCQAFRSVVSRPNEKPTPSSVTYPRSTHSAPSGSRSSGRTVPSGAA